ncbi:MAG: glycosyltransferase family 4 protein [Chloroflexi bacterium]|nr:glycosyltransferase family 4 protein [Chloroflexota bacterium]
MGSSRHKMAFDILLFLRALWSMLSVRPDLIHAHLHEGALIGAILSKLWGVPYVFDFQGSLTSEMIDHGFLKAGGRAYRFMRRLEEWIDRTAPYILTSSTHAARLLTGEFHCPPERLFCAPDAVNTAVFRPLPRDEAWVAYKRSWGIPEGRTVVVYLGLLAPYQGTDHLLRAAQILCAERDDLHFLIAGYPHLERYQRLAHDLGIEGHVTFTGRVPYDEAPRLLSLGDLAVSPKLSKTEGAGKLLNYMAMGLATVAFDTPVSREYLGEYGVYAAPEDVADLARALAELADDPPRRQALGAALRRRAEERFSWEHCGERILAVYGRALGEV